jgi:hypothetical protein
MKRNMDTLAVTTASGAAGGAVAYAVAVKSLGLVSLCLWKLGLPMVSLISGPAIIGVAAASAVVGGGVYSITRGIASRCEKLERIADENNFQDGSQ